jgi:hypothetical protein
MRAFSVAQASDAEGVNLRAELAWRAITIIGS